MRTKYLQVFCMISLGFILLYQPTSSIIGQTNSLGLVRALVWSPDGTKIATSNFDGTIQIRDAASGQVVLVLQDAQSDLDLVALALAWSPDGTQLASGGRDNKIKIWNTSTGSLILTLLESPQPEIGNPIIGLDWSLDGAEILSLTPFGGSFNLSVWDAVTGQRVYRFSTSDMYSLDRSPDQNWLATTGGDALEIWNANTGELINRSFGTNHEMLAVDWNSDNTRVATADASGLVSVWNAHTGDILATFDGFHSDAVWSVDWHPDGIHLLSAGFDGRIGIWSTATNQLEASITNSGYLFYTARWSPDGTSVTYGNAEGNLEIHSIVSNIIGNRIWLDTNGNGIQDTDETGMAGLTVHLLNNNFGIVKTVQTNAYGFYTFADLVPGTHYYIQIIPPTDTYTIAPVDRGADDTRDSDFDWRDNFGTPDPTDRVLRSMRFTASAGMQRDDLDAGFMPNSDLRVRVWRDTDGDGVQDSGEQGMANVSLFLRRANFTRYRDPLTTDSDGFATFTNLPAGDYYVQINVPSGYSLAPFNIGPDDNIDNDFAMAFDYETGSGNVPRTLRFTLAPGLIREDIDAGLKQP